MYTNFLDVECQRCGANPGEPCRKAPSGDEAEYVHQARITASKWATEDIRFPNIRIKAKGAYGN